MSKDGYLSYSVNSNRADNTSATARSLLIGAIDNQNEDNLVNSFNGLGSSAQDNVEPGLACMNIDANQIEEYIAGSENVNDKTLGYGMVFLHELNHTESGSDLSDNFGLGNPTGDNVDYMNIIRAELGNDWGQRASYKRINGFIPFDCGTLDQLLDPQQGMDKNSRFIFPSMVLDEVIIIGQ